MAKNKISEYSSTAANNTDIANINIAEGCSPSNINNAIRAVMSHLKNFQDGSSGDSLTNAGTVTSSGTLNVTGGLQLDGSAGTSGQVIVSQGSGTPIWGSGFPSGGIIMWSCTIAAIPSGWYLCDGNNGTPDLTNKFIIGADEDDGGVAKTSVTETASQSGGSKDAIVVEHNHTGTTNGGGSHTHSLNGEGIFGQARDGTGTASAGFTGGYPVGWIDGINSVGNHTHGFTTNDSGSSGTNANLPPYYALAFIMKA